VTPVQSISETDIMPASYANTFYANILCQLMPTVMACSTCGFYWPRNSTAACARGWDTDVVIFQLGSYESR
jgi:hypothetical protein